MLMRSLIVLSALALGFAASAQARPATTAPLYVLTVHVTITDTRITLDRHKAPRGVEVRFVIRNLGARPHNFTLTGRNPAASGRAGLTKTVKPRQQGVLRLFADYRGKAPYFDSLPADRGKPGMRGFFVVS